MKVLKSCRSRSGRERQRAIMAVEIHFVGRAVVVGLVQPAFIVKMEVLRQPGLQLATVLVGVQIDILVLHTATTSGQ